ncbi:hypothetical protein [Clostridium tyrobutyricum]|uniref:hypothetical protein n=1 Tax=Clostridium tyrobutyricum TaxID=1519 RepID=UPI0020CC2811|nr:hypothetical protein [Clostridium tyrobutyricum]
MKMAKCIIELERIYGIRQGSAGQPHTDNLNGKTQSDLAKQFNISQQQLQSMVEHDALKSTTAYKIWAKLSPDEQHEFFEQIGIDNIKNLTQTQTLNEIMTS